MIMSKKSGLGILNPMISEKYKYLSSHLASTEIIQAMTSGGAFSNADHRLALREEIPDGQNNWYDATDSTLKGLVRDIIDTD